MIEVLLALMVLAAAGALRSRNLLVGVVLAGVVSLLSCLVFILLAAPDVALTEAAVGTGVGSVVLVWVVSRTRRSTPTAVDAGKEQA